MYKNFKPTSSDLKSSHHTKIYCNYDILTGETVKEIMHSAFLASLNETIGSSSLMNQSEHNEKLPIGHPNYDFNNSTLMAIATLF